MRSAYRDPVRSPDTLCSHRDGELDGLRRDARHWAGPLPVQRLTARVKALGFA